MLRKRSRSSQKHQQHMAASKTDHINSFEFLPNNKHIKNSVSTVAGLFVGQGPKAMSDCDLVMSPTSPLDFINIPSPFLARKSWDTTSSKVGLRLVYSLDNKSPLVAESGKNQTKPGSESKNIVFGPQVIAPSKNKVPSKSIFEIADALEHQPQPGEEFKLSICDGKLAEISHLLASSDFLKFCYSCSKELAGEDIYIYRGDRAFCSPSCREMEMLDDEGVEESDGTTPKGHETDA